MPLALESQKITKDVWQLFQDSSGRILDEYSVRKWTFYKGISVEIRPEVWKFLLGYYPFSSTADERQRIDEDKRYGYETLLASWSKPGSVQDSTFSGYERVIEKDSWRTDRNLQFYSHEGSRNTEKLQRILKTFVAYDPAMGYIQGMNDILSVLLITLQSEHEAFWCFTEVITRMRPLLSDLTLSQPLRALARLCWYLDSPLYDHIVGVYGEEDWVFCYRWELLQLKREFSVEETCDLWERIWCDHATGHFHQFLMIAVLVHYRKQLLQCSTVEHFMEVCMKLPGTIPLHPVLTLAQGLLQRLRGDEYCPHQLRYLVSSDGCAPPPLVGFVRARQKFTTLHSTKIKLQRDQIWKSLFGDTPVQPITSPFMLSPMRNQSETTSGTPSCVTTNGSCGVNTVESQQFESNYGSNACPPKAGFVPRMSGIKFREDIRKTLHLYCEQGITGASANTNPTRTIENRMSQSQYPNLTDVVQNGIEEWQMVTSTGNSGPPQPLCSYPNGVGSDSVVKPDEDHLAVARFNQRGNATPFHATSTSQSHNGYFQTELQQNGYSSVLPTCASRIVSQPNGTENTSHNASSIPQAYTERTQNSGHQVTTSELVVNGTGHHNLKVKPTFDALRSEPQL